MHTYFLSWMQSNTFYNNPDPAVMIKFMLLLPLFMVNIRPNLCYSCIQILSQCVLFFYVFIKARIKVIHV